MSGGKDESGPSSQPKISRKLLIGLMATAIVLTVFLSVFAYRYYAADGWFRQEWFQNDSLGCQLDMAIDEFDRVHIAYEEYTYGDSAMKVMYAVKKNSGWGRTEVGVGSSLARDFQLLLGKDERVHISYAYPLSSVISSPGICYCALDNGEWTGSFYPINNLSDSRVTIDSAGTPHLLTVTKQYVDDEWKYELQHWTISSEDLTKKAVYPGDSGLGNPSSIGGFLMDDSDSPFALIEYAKDDTWFLRWVRVDAEDLVLQSNLDYGSGYPGRVADVVAGPQGAVHVLYTTTSNFEDSSLNYGFLGEMNAGTCWNVERVTAANYWADASMTLDRLANPFVVFESQAYRIESAERVNDLWTFRTVDERSSFGFSRGDMSAAMDSGGAIHAAYYAFDGHNAELLVYASSDTTAVVFEALAYAGMLTLIVTIVAVPTMIGLSIWTIRRRKTREARGQLGLYDHRLK